MIFDNVCGYFSTIYTYTMKHFTLTDKENGSISLVVFNNSKDVFTPLILNLIDSAASLTPNIDTPLRVINEHSLSDCIV